MVGGLAEWGTCPRSVSPGNYTWALSYCNNVLAIGSNDGDIITLDAISGSQADILSEHSSWVRGLEFSLGGEFLVSGGGDNVVKLWDMQTGGVVRTFHGHTTFVCSVAISADCTRIASGSGSGAIHLWDVQSGEHISTIEQKGFINHVGFFPTPTGSQHILSACGNSIQQWDLDGHQIQSAYKGSNIGFSPDYTQLAICNMNSIIIQNPSFGEIVAELHVPHDFIRQCCFSPDGRLVAAIASMTVYVWDITSSEPCLIRTLCGHSESITALVFSSPSSLISMSGNGFLMFWQIDAFSSDPVITNPKTTPLVPSQTYSVSLQARDEVAILCDQVSHVMPNPQYSIRFLTICGLLFRLPIVSAEERDRTSPWRSKLSLNSKLRRKLQNLLSLVRN